MSDLEKAIKDWERETDKVAADLIRSGVPPWEAIVRATRDVQDRRSGPPRIVPMTIR